MQTGPICQPLSTCPPRSRDLQWGSLPMFNPLAGCFFHFGLFNYILRNESGKNIFFKSGHFQSRQFGCRDLWRNHASAYDVTHGLARAEAMTWRRVVFSRVGSCGATESRRLLWHDWQPSRQAPTVHQSRQSRWSDSVTSVRLAQLMQTWTWTGAQPFFLLSPFSLLTLSRAHTGDLPVPPLTASARAASVTDLLQVCSLAFPEGSSSLLTAYILF
jgi:hypothetical protein